MSNITLDQPSSGERRYFTNGEPKSGITRIPPAEDTQGWRKKLFTDPSFVIKVRTLHRQLITYRSQEGAPLRSIGVTSCFHGECASTVAAHLAHAAGESQRLLL